MTKRLPAALVLLLLCLETALPNTRAGSIRARFILTTPEGANLPATAAEDGFPLLVRLHKDFFDFSQAKAQRRGHPLLPPPAGKPLAYQIDEWDAANGTASIWVRIPTIQGNARQEIKMYWGKADAASESSGRPCSTNPTAT